MRFRKGKRFQKAFDHLPVDIQGKARKAFLLFKEHPYPPFHPSLVVKKVKGQKMVIFEGRLDDFYRFTFEVIRQDGETVYYFRNIGPHDITSTSP
jgi:hypothetical protein